jgi:uncharacterized membrane protein
MLTLLLLTQLGLGNIIPTGVDVFATGVVTVFAILGIISNPKDGKWYFSPHTPWKTRLRSAEMWVSLAAILVELIRQILKWCNVVNLPFNLSACIMTFLSIMQATGVISGSIVSTPNP